MKRARKIIRRMGSALVVTLAVVVLISIIVTAYLAGTMLDTKVANSFLNSQRAEDMAMIGLHQAVARIRDGMGPWDDPYGNFTNSAPPFFWSVSPGRLTRWSYDSVTPQTNVALFSDPALVPNTANTTNLANLNQPRSDGSTPIVGGTNPPPLRVKWVNVLQNPAQPASASNRIVGRYAFWVDDENAKINLNTADGTRKYQTNSLGLGTPSEVSLQALESGGTALSSASAEEIAAMARNSGFPSPGDVSRAPDIPADFYAENRFNLTSYNRSPELNLFGESRQFLIPAFSAWTGAGGTFTYTYLQNNGITFQPLREIYPTPSQLPGFTGNYKIVSTATGAAATNSFNSAAPWPSGRAWPLVFLQANPRLDFCNSANFYQPNAGGYNFTLIGKYLAGTNGSGAPIRWPVFPGTAEPSDGFRGKYSPRQLDSIAMQITDLGSKATLPDANVKPNSNPNQEGVPYSVPTTTWGYLSKELVTGMGRFAKVNELAVHAVAYPETGTLGDPAYTAPYVMMEIYLEWVFPAGFRGMDLLNYASAPAAQPMLTGSTVAYGDGARQGYLNLGDLPQSLTPPLAAANAALMPPNSLWHDTLLANSAGIDFLGNPPGTSALPWADPDQAKAAANHPWAWNAGISQYAGGSRTAPNTQVQDLTRMWSLGNGYSTSASLAWWPGDYWCTQNRLPSSPFWMKPGSASVEFTGGISVLSIVNTARNDPDPVPLEAKRGRGFEGSTGELYSDATVLDRAKKSVIPVAFALPVPSTAGGVWWKAEVADPLVNKFPGDWIASESSAHTIGALPDPLAAAPNRGISRYVNGANSAALSHPNYDPESFWMPTIDPDIPRSARLPNVGYLNYLRTGIIPDDESVDFSQQHGTPYRLFSFAPSTESASQTTTLSSSLPYPDWALLDLFSIPSTLTPHGTYGGATSGRINPNGAVVYTTDVETPDPDISRTRPLEAMFLGIKVNQTITGTGSSSSWTGGSTVDAAALAQAVEAYMRDNGPLRLPGEICNVPAIAALRPAQNPTRNDLVRQTVGNLSTQSNVFSVWVAGQSIRKTPSHTLHGEFESGDAVLAEIRYHFVVERYLDPGKDGVYGNATGPGNDDVVGTWDDLVDNDNHPPKPRYLYRVVSAELIR